MHRTSSSVRITIGALSLAACAPTAATGPLSYEETIAFCAVQGACLPDWATSTDGRFGDDCLYGAQVGFSDDDLAQMRCAAETHGDCEAARACFGIHVRLDDSACTSATETEMCQGDHWVACFARDDANMRPGQVVERDCTASHQVCLANSGGGAACSQGTCTREQCASAHVVSQCEFGIRDDYTCPAGTECREDAGHVACVPTGPVCTHSVCDGDQLIRCQSLDGTTFRTAAPVDCTAVGRRCEIVMDEARCAPPHVQCDAGTFVTDCQGDSIRYCNLAGEIATFDCAAAGYASCRTSGTGLGVVTRCVPHGIDVRL